jgi:hypothetical protein
MYARVLELNATQRSLPCLIDAPAPEQHGCIIKSPVSADIELVDADSGELWVGDGLSAIRVQSQKLQNGIEFPVVCLGTDIPWAIWRTLKADKAVLD